MQTSSENHEKSIYWFELDSSIRIDVAQKYRSVSIGEIDLSVGARNMLMRHDPQMTVSSLLLADDSIAEIGGLGVITLSEINDAMMSLLSGVTFPAKSEPTSPLTITAPSQDLVNPRRKPGRKSGSKSAVVVPPPPKVELPASAANAHIGLLHLSLRRQNTLELAGIRNIRELDSHTYQELSSVVGIGPKAATDVMELLTTLRTSIDENGEVNWHRFWSDQGIKLIPEGVNEVTPDTALQLFPSLLRAMLLDESLDESREREWIIVQQRFGLDGAKVRTLDELGSAFDLSRERVRQIEERALETFRRVLLLDDYAGRSLHIDPAISDLLRTLLNRIRSAVAVGILEHELSESISKEFEVHPNRLATVIELMYELLKIKKLDFASDHLDAILYLGESPITTQTGTIVLTIHQTLSTRAEPQSDFDILLEVNKRLKKGHKISLEVLRQNLRFCSSAELTSDGRYQAKFEVLATRGDQLERILLEHESSLSVREITRTLNHRLSLSGRRALSERNVGNQLVGDSRFVAIGRSGEWALATWPISTGTIVSMMKQFLTKRNKPATADEIYDYVRAQRPLSHASVVAYLQFDPSFAQVTRTEWGLAEWREASAAKVWTAVQVGEFVENYFRSRRIDEADYKLLRKALAVASGMSEVACGHRLLRSPSLETTVVNYELRIARFNVDWKQNLDTTSQHSRRKKKTLLEEIGESVREMLIKSPNHQLSLKQILAQLTPRYANRYRRPYNVLHGYVSRLDFVEKYAADDSGTVMCRLIKEAEPNEQLKKKVQQIKTATIRENALRALSFLNEDDVDVALFLLSKEFEDALKQYVLSAIKLGQIVANVTASSRLFDLVTTVDKAGILDDSAAVHFLRQSRNKRAHGSMPSKEERKIMMNNISITAGMYIDYICFFDDLYTENTKQGETELP
jgi:hypothetical protein